MYRLKPSITMKIAEIFKQYIWITETLYRTGGLSFQELNERWMKTKISGGLPIPRTTFIRHKGDIEDMFGVNIECQRKGGYFYYIENNDFTHNNHLQEWMLDSLSISSMLMESTSLQKPHHFGEYSCRKGVPATHHQCHETRAQVADDLPQVQPAGKLHDHHRTVCHQGIQAAVVSAGPKSETGNSFHLCTGPH